MTRTGNEYDEDQIRECVMRTSLTGTPGEPETYKYIEAQRELKLLRGWDVPESTLRRWVREHPDYISAVKVVLSIEDEKKLVGIIGKGLTVVLAGLEAMEKKNPKEFTATDIKQITTAVAILMDKKKILDASHDAANKIPGQQEIVFTADSAQEFRDKNGNTHYDINGDPIAQHPGQTAIGEQSPSGEA